jgi:UDP-N-acetylmuramoyl-L-alanyl-D-glutamate--2,6-diaminopimelate ligase
MKFRELLGGTGRAGVVGDADPDIASLAYDSERVDTGALFFCVRGQRADGHDFAPAAVQRGAVALVAERPVELPVPQALVTNARAAMAPIAARFWRDPTARLRVVGITGTNGKTTTTFLVRHVLEAQGIQTGLLGTVKSIVGKREEEVERTTPEAIDLQRTFSRMLAAGDAACAMEVSSHALAQHRTDGVRFRVAVFTNLTQDHLDFHRDMEDYFTAKRSLFLPAPGAGLPALAVVNTDDPYGARIAADVRRVGGPPLRTLSPSGLEGADYRALEPSFDASGARFRCAWSGGEIEVRTPLAGHFNVENALAAIAACHGPAFPGDSNRSKQASRLRCSSTTRTRRTRSRTCWARLAC